MTRAVPSKVTEWLDKDIKTHDTLSDIAIFFEDESDMHFKRCVFFAFDELVGVITCNNGKFAIPKATILSVSRDMNGTLVPVNID